MSKQAFKRVRRALKMEVNRKPLDAYAWPGGYPLFYLCADGGALCPECVNKEIDLIAPQTTGPAGYPHWPDKQWRLVGVDVNYEDNSLYCDHCDRQIESAYGNDEDDEDSTLEYPTEHEDLHGVSEPNDCPECSRSHGPHYRGECTH